MAFNRVDEETAYGIVLLAGRDDLDSRLQSYGEDADDEDYDARDYDELNEEEWVEARAKMEFTFKVKYPSGLNPYRDNMDEFQDWAIDCVGEIIESLLEIRRGDIDAHSVYSPVATV